MQLTTRMFARAVAVLAALNCVWLESAAWAGSPGSETGRVTSALASPKVRVLSERAGKADTKGRAKLVTEFTAENRGHFPLIEDSLVTFVYSGRVAVRACVPSDLNGWDTRADQMQRLADTDLHFRTLKLPPDARIDYKFYVDGAWMLDPLNSRTVRGGFGDNSAFAMPDYEDPWEIAPADSARRGKIEEHQFSSKILGNTRRIQVYLPPGYRPAATAKAPQSRGGATGAAPPVSSDRCPAVFVQDGGEYITLGSMVNVLDNLVARGVVPPVVAVFIDPDDRNHEYYLNSDYERMMVEELVPFIRNTYGVARRPADTAIMGASLGGEISLMIALDRPEVFGKCGSQSGAFTIEDGELIGMVRDLARQPVDLYLDCGTFENLLASNRSMRDVLEEKGYRLRYQELNEGHSWGNWRAHIDDALTFFWGR